MSGEKVYFLWNNDGLVWGTADYVWSDVGPTNNLTGTCAVPPAAAVSIGVPVDNTVGTAYLSGNDISAAVWDTQTTNLSATGSIGERLKNASTVDTTAATVAAYDI